MKKIQQYSKTIPECDLENIPTDLSENLDHYIYGAPKKTGNEN